MVTFSRVWLVYRLSMVRVRVISFTKFWLDIYIYIDMFSVKLIGKTCVYTCISPLFLRQSHSCAPCSMLMYNKFLAFTVSQRLNKWHEKIQTNLSAFPSDTLPAIDGSYSFRSRSDRRKSNTPHESVPQTVTCSLVRVCVYARVCVITCQLPTMQFVNNDNANNAQPMDNCSAQREPLQITKRSQSSSQIPTFNYTASDAELNVSGGVTDDGDVECHNDLAPLPLQRRRISRPTSNYVLMNKNHIDAKLRDLRLVVITDIHGHLYAWMHREYRPSFVEAVVT